MSACLLLSAGSNVQTTNISAKVSNFHDLGSLDPNCVSYIDNLYTPPICGYIFEAKIIINNS